MKILLIGLEKSYSFFSKVPLNEQFCCNQMLSRIITESSNNP